MDANTVYTVAKALPEREYIQLLKLLQIDFERVKKRRAVKVQQPVLTDEEAVIYLLDNVFNKKNRNRTARTSKQ